MTLYGTIESYDAHAGVGMINPETGSPALRFDRADLAQPGSEPMVYQRFSYQTSVDESGNERAVNLRYKGEVSAQEAQARQQRG